MPKKAPELGALAVTRIKTPGLHFVGGVAGLALQVLSTGGRTWVLRVVIGDRRRDMGLGGFPDVPLGDAREAARRAREKIRAGVDPINEARAAKSRLKAAAASLTSFKVSAESYIADNETGWKNEKHREQWRNTLESYAYPKIGALAVQDIRTDHVLDIIKPMWRDKPETANRVRGRIEMILDAAKAEGRIAEPWQNPARWRGHLDKLLPPRSKVNRVRHHPALPIDEISKFMVALRQVDGMGARSLEFAILTAGRSGEVRGATWSEIDLEARTWILPPDRMKAGREHRVPLSRPAVALLKALPRIAGTDLVFPAPRGGQLSDMTLTAVVRRLKASAVPHGFRSTFRDWAAERTAYPGEMAEMALAHAVGDKTEAAYRRGDRKLTARFWDEWEGEQEVAHRFWETPIAGRALRDGGYYPYQASADSHTSDDVLWRRIFFRAGDIVKILGTDIEHVAGYAEKSGDMTRKVGRKETYDWDALWTAFTAKIGSDGLPESNNEEGWQTQSDVATWMGDQAERGRNGRRPSESTLKEKARLFLDRARKSGN